MSSGTSNVVDLTGDTDAAKRATRQPETKKQKTEKKAKKLKYVYLVIHDKEPQDSGSDYQRSAFLPSRCDSEIVGVFTSYDKAVTAAQDYLVDRDFVDMDDEDIDEDEDDESWRQKYFGEIDWYDRGWYREEDSDVNEMNDRIYIEQRTLDATAV